MRLLLVVTGMVVGALAGIWLSISFLPEASPAGPMLLGGLPSLGFGCWTYLGCRAGNGQRPDPSSGSTQPVLLFIALGVVAIHLLLLIGAYMVAQR